MILTIIPARSGSKGLKNKNIQKISNKTLIDHRIDMVKKAKLTNNQIILSTDSKKYKKLYEKKILVPFLRPKNLALDKSETFPLLLHAINFFKKKKQFFKYLILLEPPTPFLRPDCLKKGLNLLKKKDADMVSSISETEINSNFISTIGKDNNLNLMMKKINKIPTYQRQSFLTEYRMDGGFYMFKVSYLESTKKLFCSKMKAYGVKINRVDGFNIETIDDLKIARCMNKN